MQLTITDLDPIPPAQRTWGGIDYWAYWWYVGKKTVAMHTLILV